jgi:hypothetical protein
MPEGTSSAGTHRLRTLLIGIIVVLVAAELGTRAIASGLPAPLQWQSYETQRKVQEIDELSRHGGADIVFLGSSLTDVGVEPAVIDHQIGGGITSYNAGLASSVPRLDAAWAESIVIPKLHPKMLVLGLGAYDLGGEGGPDRTAFLNAFLNSSGAKHAMGKEDPIQAANYWIGQYSALWDHKYQLRDPATVLRAVVRHPQPVDTSTLEANDVDALGRETADQYAPFSNQARIDVSDWTLGTKDPAALRQLIAYATKRHITVVLVNMPVTNQSVDRMPPGTYNTYKLALLKIGASTGTKVLDFDTIRSTSYFLDDIHLNHAGVTLFSTRLGTALKPLVH